MTYFIKQGNSYAPTNEVNLHFNEKLPVGTYLIGFDVKGNPYFEVVDSFKPLNKYYGDTVQKANRILNTYRSRQGSTGVLLFGEKGSGKTLLSKYVSILGYELNIPTIIINTPLIGDLFSQILQMIDQECILLFDEFEKVYDEKTQHKLLTILDGVFTTKKLFMFTTNDKYKVTSHLHNRPGRIFYSIEYKGLSEEFIKEYCEDNLNDKKHIINLCKISTLYRSFNFDILQAIVEEMNRYNESAKEALNIINAKPENDSAQINYEVKAYLPVHGKLKQIPKENLDTDFIRGNLVSLQNFNVYFDVDKIEAEIIIEEGDFQSISETGELIFINPIGEKVVLTPVTEKIRPNIFDLI